MKQAALALLAALFSMTVSAQTELPLPDVPSNLKTPEQRASYVLKHFWDGMNWQDTTLTRDRMFLEQNSANFYSIFGITDSISESEAVKRMLDAAAIDSIAYQEIADIARVYLYEPESPVVNEEAYLVVSDCLLRDGRLNRADLLRLEDAREGMLQNRLGHKAIDFTITSRDGSNTSLYDETAKHEQTILIFYDPDCHDCEMLEKTLATANLKNKAVLMVYPYGIGDESWSVHAAKQPTEWTVGYASDPDFEESEIYDIRVTPTVYLLDRQANVLSKNRNEIVKQAIY